MEKILRIEPLTFRLNKNDCNEYEGYQIITTDQTIKIGIANGQCCCEDWGCIITNDTTDEFLNSKLKGISIVDKALNNKKIEALEYSESEQAMFVNLDTTAGLLQFVAYNIHNGYYAHDAVLISKQLNSNPTL